MNLWAENTVTYDRKLSARKPRNRQAEVGVCHFVAIYVRPKPESEYILFGAGWKLHLLTTTLNNSSSTMAIPSFRYMKTMESMCIV